MASKNDTLENTLFLTTDYPSSIAKMKQIFNAKRYSSIKVLVVNLALFIRGNPIFKTLEDAIFTEPGKRQPSHALELLLSFGDEFHKLEWETYFAPIFENAPIETIVIYTGFDMLEPTPFRVFMAYAFRSISLAKIGLKVEILESIDPEKTPENNSVEAFHHSLYWSFWFYEDETKFVEENHDLDLNKYPIFFCMSELEVSFRLLISGHDVLRSMYLFKFIFGAPNRRSLSLVNFMPGSGVYMENYSWNTIDSVLDLSMKYSFTVDRLKSNITARYTLYSTFKRFLSYFGELHSLSLTNCYFRADLQDTRSECRMEYCWEDVNCLLNYILSLSILKFRVIVQKRKHKGFEGGCIFASQALNATFDSFQERLDLKSEEKDCAITNIIWNDGECVFPRTMLPFYHS